MSSPSNWRDVKAKARAVDPGWDSDERVIRRARMREEMLASVSGAQLADIRKQLGLTQVQLAQAAGLSQARISQIESGTATSLESLRAYVAGLGGPLRDGQPWAWAASWIQVVVTALVVPIAGIVQ